MVSVVLAALGHVLFSGTSVPGWTLAAGTVCWCLADGERELAAVARGDLAEAAAIVAADTAPHGGRTYDLVGTPVTAPGVAARLGVPHRTIGLGEYRRRLLDPAAGLPPFQPPMLPSIATGVRHDSLDGTAADLTPLLGRPLRDPLTTATRAAAATRPATAN